MSLLIARFNNGNCCNGSNCNNDFNDNCNSTWDNWGRWAFLGLVIVFFVFAAVAFSCINARRRRRYGMAPRYGTGWAAGKTPFGHNAPQYNNNTQNNGAAPPYTAPPPVYGQNTGNTFNSNDGYYGQQTGVELQQPQNVYTQAPRAESGYAPPAGAPPAKN